MSKSTNTNMAPEQKKRINWSAIKTNIIVAFVFLATGLVGGYFTSINVISDTRATVVKDFQLVTASKENR